MGKSRIVLVLATFIGLSLASTSSSGGAQVSSPPRPLELVPITPGGAHSDDLDDELDDDWRGRSYTLTGSTVHSSEPEYCTSYTRCTEGVLSPLPISTHVKYMNKIRRLSSHSIPNQRKRRRSGINFMTGYGLLSGSPAWTLAGLLMG